MEIRNQVVQLTVVCPPHPVHLSLTSGSRLVEVTCCTRCLVHYCRRLKTIGQNDVRVHGSHVKMVYHRVLHSVRSVSQIVKLGDDFGTHFIKVSDLVQWDLLLHLQSMGHGASHIVSKVLTHLRVLGWRGQCDNMFMSRSGQPITYEYVQTTCFCSD